MGEGANGFLARYSGDDVNTVVPYKGSKVQGSTRRIFINTEKLTRCQIRQVSRGVQCSKRSRSLEFLHKPVQTSSTKISAGYLELLNYTGYAQNRTLVGT